jgi:hypothetical protein
MPSSIIRKVQSLPTLLFKPSKPTSSLQPTTSIDDTLPLSENFTKRQQLAKHLLEYIDIALHDSQPQIYWMNDADNKFPMNIK